MPASTDTPRRRLPPLILHPFAQPADPARLLQASRASLVLQGLLPEEELSVERLQQQLLEGRYSEVCMLFYLGKDVLRWADQCVEAVSRQGLSPGSHYTRQSFLTLLIEDPPAAVDHKLRSWGVQEYKRIFSRAAGLHAVFEQLPPRNILSADFLRNYHRIADYLYACCQQLEPFTPAAASQFEFEVYASGEYARMLERQWEEGA
ncbi:MAG: hypothetical protein ACPL88_12635 [Bryobacteraceae bacterium]